LVVRNSAYEFLSEMTKSMCIYNYSISILW